MTAVAPTLLETPLSPSRIAFLRERGMGSSVFVAALTAAFGVILVDTTGFLGALLQSDPTIGDSKTLAYVVQILSVLLDHFSAQAPLFKPGSAGAIAIEDDTLYVVSDSEERLYVFEIER